MINTRKYNTKRGTFSLTEKELARKTQDGVVIVVRPQSTGTIGVFAINVSTGLSIGINWYEVEDTVEIATAVTSLNRDLDKFYGRGEAMSSRGRFRVK